jgi:hypothetical protein
LPGFPFGTKRASPYQKAGALKSITSIRSGVTWTSLARIEAAALRAGHHRLPRPVDEFDLVDADVSQRRKDDVGVPAGPLARLRVGVVDREGFDQAEADAVILVLLVRAVAAEVAGGIDAVREGPAAGVLGSGNGRQRAEGRGHADEAAAGDGLRDSLIRDSFSVCVVRMRDSRVATIADRASFLDRASPGSGNIKGFPSRVRGRSARSETG